MKLFGKEVSWKLLIVLTILLSPFIYNLDAIQGWIKFEIMCRKEGGVRFYGHAERNSGWFVESRRDGADVSRSAIEGPFIFGSVLFVRYRDNDGREVDVRLVDPSAFGDKRYSFSSGDPTVEPRYKYTAIIDSRRDDERFKTWRTSVSDISSNKLVAEHVAFGFEWAKRDRVLLSAPTISTCHLTGKTSQAFYKRIYSSGEAEK